MSVQNIIYEILKIPVSKLKIYFSKLSRNSVENILIYVLSRLEGSDQFTIEIINKYREILDKFRNRPNFLEELKAKEATSKDLAKGNKLLQIAEKEIKLQQIELFAESLAKFEELDEKEKAVDAEIQSHKEKLKAKGDPFADLL